MPQNGVHLNGAVVREKREALLQSQEELAKGVGIHPNTLLRIERDRDYRVSFRTIKKLAKKLGCIPVDLMREPEKESA